ncbi:MAG TPA: DEAD/DEAH box helicase [Candidatus Thalassarchaeaceae archaeon]|jgi:ATP-dependent RNA helicase DeaD|nr:DEAD/DEAH box helicase [Candidatus Thalassarchaeaceae archaeon]MDP7658987.1 DEAD/DEAH box helicase [Candidatus Thalassarchaeaceae archaeon]HJO42712.1 DEAD/DEAH box helicase [Candidatus Thalassarchaeaceae archaeon]|tara:strand:+ start:673 stop:2097 length:1425 start_codon:yes stop_codon:yes gene_type:complete
MSQDGIVFSDWNLKTEVAAAIDEKGWTIPTEIQVESIPVARNGRDIVGQARTGSGKTAAFGIPIIESCSATGSPQAIILCPTRELAVQVSEEISWLQGQLGLSIQTVYGGTDIEKQAKSLDSGADIIVGTPGRVIDMAKRGHLKLGEISHFCLDEADRMLDMGFFPDVLWIFEQMPSREQTLLFSATFPQEVLDAAEEFMNDPAYVMSDDLDVEVPEIEQYAVRIGRANKLWVLGRIIANMNDEDQMLIFTNTKRMVDLLEERLSKFGMKAIGLHGDKAQNKREKILSSLKERRERIVVATDVAARGIDVDGITHVVNYDLPDDTESYVHRIGRTGRMGRKGEAWSLVSKEDVSSLDKISNTWNLEIPYIEVPSLPEGISRDPVRKRDDWSEVTDPFGMVNIAIKVGNSSTTKRALADWIIEQARIPEIAIGEITMNSETSTVQVHVDKAAYVIDVIKKRPMDGNSLNPAIIGA